MDKPEIQDEEVSWEALDIPIRGTITSPRRESNGSSIVFMAGSGPTDRNWCSPLLPGNNGSGKLLAEKLAMHGFVTLRFDKLGSGPRVREDVSKFSGKISMDSHVEQLKGAVETILSKRNVSKENIFALTNSEGAIHAVNYQLQEKKNRFRGLVLTGAPGRAIGDVSRTQIYSRARSLPNAETLMSHYDRAIADFVAARPIVIDPSLPESIRPLFRALEVPANLPFSRELWTYDLSKHISGIDEPFLVLIGKKDIQIDWRLDGGPLEQAAKGKTNSTFSYPENADHVLKHEDLPREKITAEYVTTHYNSPDSVLDDEAVKTISDWLISH